MIGTTSANFGTTLTATGNTILGGTLVASGASSLKSNLGVGGTTTLSGATTIEAATDIYGNLSLRDGGYATPLWKFTATQGVSKVVHLDSGASNGAPGIAPLLEMFNEAQDVAPSTFADMPGIRFKKLGPRNVANNANTTAGLRFLASGLSSASATTTQAQYFVWDYQPDMSTGTPSSLMTLSSTGILAATTFSGELAGTISSATTATTQSSGDNSTKVATTAYADAAAGGGGGTPGGSNTQVQFNNGGSFGGDADFLFDGTDVTIINKLHLGATANNNYLKTNGNRLDFYISNNPRIHLDAGKLFSATSGGPLLDLTPTTNEANYGFVDDPDTGMSRSAANTLHFLTAGVTGATMDNQQRLALGTSTIHGNSRLTISQAGTSDDHGISMTSDGSNFQHIYVDASDKLILKGTNDINLIATDDINLTAGTSTDHDIYMGSDNVLIYNANYAAQYVQFDGGTQRVGIGTTAPGFPLSVSGTQYDMAKIASSHAAGVALYLDADGAGGSNWHLQSTANSAGTGGGKLDFVEAGTSRMVIAGGGNVGIGTTSPSNLLHIAGHANPLNYKELLGKVELGEYFWRLYHRFR